MQTLDAGVDVSMPRTSIGLEALVPRVQVGDQAADPPRPVVAVGADDELARLDGLVVGGCDRLGQPELDLEVVAGQQRCDRVPHSMNVTVRESSASS